MTIYNKLFVFGNGYYNKSQCITMIFVGFCFLHASNSPHNVLFFFQKSTRGKQPEESANHKQQKKTCD